MVPVVMALLTSFQPTRENPDGGFQNYVDVVTDFRFLPAALNVLTFLAIYLPAMLIIVTIMAMLLDAYKSKFNASLRLAFIVPSAISGSVAVLVWYFMLEPTLSPFRGALNAMGITQASQIWSPGNLAWIFALMAFATGAGNWIVIQYGSLQSIDDELLEAARIDGANALQLAVRIKLPLIRKYLVYMAVLTFAAGVQVFVEPQLISAGVYEGLATDWALNQVGYSFAFTNNDFAGAAALSFVLFVVCLLAALYLIFGTDFFERREEE
ncbi:carbohydrate ABC transporter permease [Microbacterium sp. SLBN-154]|uniref:carbohydrate ABC transporter permease n=1 Tax=Microbacterium sp. SLBN-154 TaxID=2768458 RepID=UPI001356C27D|nr:sugar ABC transporter permease [Microbacterium sp. SLBN-154]